MGRGLSIYDGSPTLNVCAVDFEAVLAHKACSFSSCWQMSCAVVCCRVRDPLASIAMPSPDK